MYKASTLLIVQNLEEARWFYGNILGLKIVSEHPTRLHLAMGGHEMVIFQGDGPAVRSKHGSDANSCLIFWTDDLDSKIDEMTSKGVDFIHDSAVSNSWGRYCAFKDPSGIVHELFEPNTS